MMSIVNSIFQVGQKERLVNGGGKIYGIVRHRGKSANDLMSLDPCLATDGDTDETLRERLYQRQDCLIPDRKSEIYLYNRKREL